MSALLDSLPAMYRDLLPSFFRGEVPPETKATCSNCAMSEAGCQGKVESVDGASRLFRPDTKCCTYHPRLPNFLVGALLSDDSPAMAEGRGRVEAKLATRSGVTPQWVKPSAKYNLLYRSARGAFGRSASLLCPYFVAEGGNCSIWAYREAVCSTYFCKYVSGADGRKFWMTVKTYLSLTEIQLSRWVALQLMPEYVLSGKDKAESAGEILTPEDLDGEAPPEAEYRALWGAWAGREAEFYRACHERVRALTPAAFERILGFDGDVELALLERLHRAAFRPELPPVLKLNPAATVQWLPDGSVALGCYSEVDALALPGAAYPLLTEFTGKEPVATVRERLRREKQADLFEDVLLELHRHRILVVPEPVSS